MSDAKTEPEAKPAPKVEAKPKLARAGESGDPTIQKLLAEREIHEMSVRPDPSLAAQRENAEAAIKRIDAELAELGFTAQ